MRIKLCLFYVAFSLTNYIYCKNTEKTNSKTNNMNTFIKMHGTYQIAAICKDGIVVATDTRCSIDDGNKHIMCYYDSVQKVFPFKNYAISSSGSILINGKYLFYYYKQFEAANLYKGKISDNVKLFFNYMFEKYPEAASVMERTNKLIFAGYEGKTPVLFIAAKGQLQGVREAGFVCEDNLCDFKYNPDITCLEMAKVIEQSIINYVKKYNKELEINTHISILKIDIQNQFSWILNPPILDKWEELSDFVNAYKTNKISLNFTSERNKALILKELIRY